MVAKKKAKRAKAKRRASRDTSKTSHSLPLGEKVFIRTHTMYYTGRVVSITDCDIVLADAAWIADTGKFNDALRTGIFDAVEPFIDDVIVSRATLVDVTRWPHALMRRSKQ